MAPRAGQADPASPEPSAAPASPEGAPASAAPEDGRTGARVLYIDDDPGLARLVRRALEADGHRVEHAASGAAGLERVRAGGIDVVALDHHMPGEDGLEVLPRLRALADAPPVIYVTGSNDIKVAVAALKAGAVDYVWKDVDGHFRELLAAAVHTAMAGERLREAKRRADEEMRLARERAETLLQEVNHRVANSLALVATLARMQARGLADPAGRAAIAAVEARIHAIAGIHRQLYTADDVTTIDMALHLNGLVAELGTSLGIGREDGAASIRAVRLECDPLRLATSRAVSVGVIVSELVTNAAKYAYPAPASGEVRVSFKALGADAELAVEDDGIGQADGEAPKGTGLGGRIIGAMATTLGASVTRGPVRPAPKEGAVGGAGPGSRVSLRFPLQT